MTSNIEKLDNMNERLTIEIDQETFANAMKKVFQKQKRHFDVPGFRKGKAPFNIVLNYYGEGMFYEDALNLVVIPAYQEALEEHEGTPYSSPNVEIQEVGLDKGVSFTAEYAVKPEVKLGKYRGLTAFRPDDSVSDDEVLAKIDDMRTEMARLIPVTDRPVKEDDLVTMDYKGSVDGVPFEGGEAENYTLTIGSGSFIPGFEEALIGHKAGEEFDIDVTFPAEYHAEDLAGKDAVFHILVHEIKEKEIPELDDEFVKDISEECDTVDEYKATVRRHLEEERTKQADQTFVNRLLEQIIETSEFKMSELILADGVQEHYDRQANNLRMYGLSMTQYLSIIGKTPQQFMQELKPPTRKALEASFALAAIADKEGFTGSDAEVEKELDRQAEELNIDREKLDTYHTNSTLTNLKEEIRIRKATDFLKKNNRPTDVDPDLKDDKEETPSEEATEAKKQEENEASPKKSTTKTQSEQAAEKKAAESEEK